MFFQSLGFSASLVLDELTSKRGAACKEGLVIEDRRIDASLLTENYSRYWNVREEAAERERQNRLLERLRRPGSRGRRGRLS
jgi:hypothetical protein